MENAPRIENRVDFGSIFKYDENETEALWNGLWF